MFVVIYHADYPTTFGPFASHDEAQAWIDAQPGNESCLYEIVEGVWE